MSGAKRMRKSDKSVGTITINNLSAIKNIVCLSINNTLIKVELLEIAKYARLLKLTHTTS